MPRWISSIKTLFSKVEPSPEVVTAEWPLPVPGLSESDIKSLLTYAAEQNKIDPALVIAVAQQESSLDTWATRFEPAFFNRYIASKPTVKLGGHWPKHRSEATERNLRSTSWGLMQIMGQTARERGFLGDLTWLLYPPIGAHWGCVQLARLLRNSKGDVNAALLAYNGGGNKRYPNEVLGRIKP